MTRQERMKGAIAWMTRNPVAANLLMFSLVAGGFSMAFFEVREEVFPQIELDIIQVAVPYPGASPAEVENGIVLAIEEAVRPIDGVKEVTGSANEGAGSVMIELQIGVDKSKALADVKNAVDRIVTFPRDAERPMVMAPKFKAEAISVVLYGDQDEKVLHALAEQTRAELLQLPDITYVELSDTRPLEIAIEVPQDTLRTYGLTLPQIADTVRRTALELPAGGVKTEAGEVLLRTAERRDLGAEFDGISVLTSTDGSTVSLGDIAHIEDGFAETDAYATYEGKPAVTIRVFSVGDQSPPEVARAAKRYVEELRERLPPGMQVSTWGDLSELYSERLDLMLRNAGLGLILVFGILGLFLEPRLAFWVTLGIPISFLGSFLILPAADVSLNMISLFAFIVTLGMVVDDAIVVGENIFRIRNEGVPPIKAAVLGAREMAMPVFFSIATTVAAFSPFLFLPGVMGKFLGAIPVVVILVLSISLIESFFVLPAHLGHIGKPGLLAGLIRQQQRVSKGIERFIRRFYAPLVAAAVRQRWITLAIAIGVFIISLGLFAGGFVKFIDFPEEESDWIVVNAELPFGAPIKETEAVMEKLVRTAQQVIEENGGEAINRGIFARIGGGDRSSGSHLCFVVANLVPTTQRSITSSEFAEQWRKKAGHIPGLESLRFQSSTGHASQHPIDIKLSHGDVAVLEEAAREMARQLEEFEGIKDIDNGIDLGKQQLDFTLSPAGISAGLTSADLANQVRSSFYGAEALRQQRGRNEIRVMVRLPRHERESLANVEELMVRTPQGGEMPLRDAAQVHRGRAYTSITRTDGQRTIRVKAGIEEKRTNAQEVMAAVFRDAAPKLRARFPGLTLEVAGRQKNRDEFMSFIKLALGLALIGIFCLIAIPLRSYLQPIFVVMAAIPFGFAGAVFGHLIMGFDWSNVSFFGFVALAGVVVNDSLVFVDAANRFRQQGLSAVEAATKAAVQRFRPIILTSLTTFGGLTPMILETSVQARVLIPMAIALGFGVLFATLITLLLVPSLFTMVETPRDWWRAYRASRMVDVPSTAGDLA